MLLHLLFKTNNPLCPAEDHRDVANLETVLETDGTKSKLLLLNRAFPNWS